MAGGNSTLLFAVAGGLFAYGFMRSQASASIAPATPVAPVAPPPATPASPPADPWGDPASYYPAPPGYATPPHIIAPSGVAKPWHVSTTERAAIKNIERLRLTRYPDGSGYSIGWGHNIVASDNIGTTITTARAQALFNADMATVEHALNTLVHVALDQNEIDALGDFIFNEGPGAFARSTLLSRLNARDYQGAASELARWHYANGTSNAALVARRATEAAQFQRGLTYA